MTTHFEYVVVIGGSAGAVEVLKDMIPRLDENFGAPVLIVVHIPPQSFSVLPQILSRHTGLRVRHAKNTDDLEPGTVYIAPPDHHLAVSETQACLLSGARINRNRPSIDPLFISAARAFGPRVIAVLLSGYLDDGVAGLIAVKEAGGLVIVQDPESTMHRAMPKAALARVAADFTLQPHEIAEKLNALLAAGKQAMMNGSVPNEPADLTLDELTRSSETPEPQPSAELSAMSCPDCGGVLQAIDGPLPDRFRCRVGHAFSFDSLLAAKSDEIETALWTAVRALEEKSEMSRSLSTRLRVRGVRTSSARYADIAADLQRDANIIRTVLDRVAREDSVDAEVAEA